MRQLFEREAEAIRSLLSEGPAYPAELERRLGWPEGMGVKTLHGLIRLGYVYKSQFQRRYRLYKVACCPVCEKDWEEETQS